MKNHRLLPLCLVLLTLALLAGCGNKGALVRPSAATDKPASS